MAYSVLPEKRNPNDVIICKESDINAPIETVFDVMTDILSFVELEEGVYGEVVGGMVANVKKYSEQKAREGK